MLTIDGGDGAGTAKGGGLLRVLAVAPSAAEVARLETELAVPPGFVTHSLDPRERARVERSGDATLVVLRIPVRAGPKAPLPWITRPIGVVLTPRGVVTIAAEGGPLLDAPGADLALAPGGAPVPAYDVVLETLRRVADAYLDELEVLERAIDEVEARLERSLENREVLELVRLQKSLVYFTAALAALEQVLERLARTGWLGEGVDPAAYEEVLIEVRQALAIANLERETLGETMDAFASIISNNLNSVMKVLTVFTLMLTPPVAIASFYGMNVILPGATHPGAFAAIVVGSLVLAGGLAVWFRRRGWL